jgi:hypothetical protein
MIKMSLDLDKLELFKAIDPHGFTEAFVASANEVAHDTVAILGNRVQDKWNINIAETQANRFEVRSILDGTANSRGSTMTIRPAQKNNPSGTISLTFKGYPINLSRFVTDWEPARLKRHSSSRSYSVKSPPRVKIERQHRRSIIIKKSFTATMKSGHKGVFQRNRDGANHKILELRTITLPSMLHQIGITKTLGEEIDANFGQAFDDRYYDWYKKQ